MRAPTATTLLLLSAGWILGACSSDLFHSTSWPSLCDQTPSAPGCGLEVADAADAAQELAAQDGPDAAQDVADAQVDGPADVDGDSAAE